MPALIFGLKPTCRVVETDPGGRQEAQPTSTRTGPARSTRDGGASFGRGSRWSTTRSDEQRTDSDRPAPTELLAAVGAPNLIAFRAARSYSGRTTIPARRAVLPRLGFHDMQFRLTVMPNIPWPSAIGLPRSPISPPGRARKCVDRGTA